MRGIGYIGAVMGLVMALACGWVGASGVATDRRGVVLMHAVVEDSAGMGERLVKTKARFLAGPGDRVESLTRLEAPEFYIVGRGVGVGARNGTESDVTNLRAAEGWPVAAGAADSHLARGPPDEVS